MQLHLGASIFFQFAKKMVLGMKKYGVLLSAAEHKALKTAAAERGVLMQDIARNAVLAALSSTDVLPAKYPARIDEDLITSLNAVAQKLKEAATALDETLDQISQEGAVSTNAIESTDADERAITPAVGHAIATEQRRVVGGILQGVEGIIGGTGEGVGGAEGTVRGAKEAARRDGVTRRRK